MTAADKGQVVQFRHPVERCALFYAVPETINRVETARLRAWWMEGFEQGRRPHAPVTGVKPPFGINHLGFLAWEAGLALGEGEMDWAFIHASALREELAELGLLPETVDQGPGAAA